VSKIISQAYKLVTLTITNKLFVTLSGTDVPQYGNIDSYNYSVQLGGIQPVIIGRVLDVHVACACSCCAFISLYELILSGSTEGSVVHCLVVCLFQHFHILALQRVMNIFHFLCMKLMNSDAPVASSLACFLMKSTDTYINR
jgi:hypothetical protein